MTSVAIEYMLQQAFEYHQASDLSRAEKLYRASLAIDPNNLNALQLFGVLNHQIGMHLDAVSLLRAIILLEQDGEPAAQHAVLYNNLGNALRALGRGDEALPQYRRGIALNPDLAELHANLADELCAQGDFNIPNFVTCRLGRQTQSQNVIERFSPQSDRMRMLMNLFFHFISTAKYENRLRPPSILSITVGPGLFSIWDLRCKLPPRRSRLP